MNTAPTQSATAVAVDMPSSSAAGPEAAGDLFALLLGSLGSSLAGEAPEGASPTTTKLDDEPAGNEGDFSLLLCQLPGMDGLGLQATPPANTTFHFGAESANGAPGADLMAWQNAAPQPPAITPEATLADLANDSTNPLFGSADADAALPDGTTPGASVLGGAAARALQERTELRSVELPLHTLPPALHEAKDAGKLDLVLPPGSAGSVAEAFSEGMAVRIGWMAEQQVGRAEIQLHPEDLGAIDVALEFDGRSVRAEFTSANEDVRQLIESTLPRLRDLLETQGFSLRDASVGAEQQGNRQLPGDARHAFGPATTPARGEATTTTTAAPARRAMDHGGSLSEYA